MFGQFEMTCTTMYILLGYGVLRTFNYISLILLEEIGVPEENHQPAAQGEYSYLNKKRHRLLFVCYFETKIQIYQQIFRLKNFTQ